MLYHWAKKQQQMLHGNEAQALNPYAPMTPSLSISMLVGVTRTWVMGRAAMMGATATAQRSDANKPRKNPLLCSTCVSCEKFDRHLGARALLSHQTVNATRLVIPRMLPVTAIRHTSSRWSPTLHVIDTSVEGPRHSPGSLGYLREVWRGASASRAPLPIRRPDVGGGNGAVAADAIAAIGSELPVPQDTQLKVGI
eukprot:CAMPEP_0172039100 /NCGR_PEP_ID=MMETSP1041-20130122/23704_1 /TAXON_ID=464988 /ORGANISM="Hemiselmis andersenii, Strain CCMP439" /LENGTH=195 /DNA_ID=CAMNT_0012696747 /DNA_START=544 /DNA_END=1132 /DNA_ORIENTATION=-